MAKQQNASRRGVLALAGLSFALNLPPTAQAAASAPSVSLQRLEWAGIRMRSGAVEVLIDVSGAAATAPTGSRTFALATHHHGDHLDVKALQRLLGDRGYLVLHKDVARMIDLRSVKVQIVDMYEPVFLPRASGTFIAWCVPASDGFGDPQVSWVVDCGGRRVIHCGDTLWHGHWWNIARAYGPFDAALVPVNGARQPGSHFSDVGQPMVMGPEQAAAAAKALTAKLAIPIHYGMSDPPDYIEIENAEQRFLDAAKGLEVATRIMKAGETLAL